MRPAMAKMRLEDGSDKFVRCDWLAWSTDYEELRDGVGQYPAAIVETGEGVVHVVAAANVVFSRDLERRQGQR